MNMNAFYEGAVKFFITWLGWIFGLLCAISTFAFLYHILLVMHWITFQTEKEPTPAAGFYFMGMMLFFLFSIGMHGLRQIADSGELFDWTNKDK